MQYKILNIYEEDYGCEGVPEGQEPMCRVQIQDEKGTEQWISIADRVLREGRRFHRKEGGNLMQYQVEAQRIYYADPSGTVLAEITFPEVEPGVYCIDHTVVDDSLRGQGIAGQLVQMAVEQIQAKHGTVTATCSYAKHWLEKHAVS